MLDTYLKLIFLDEREFLVDKEVHIVVPFVYLSSLCSKFEWAERGDTGSHKKAEW